MTRRTCDTCYWWNRHSGLAVGDCQRRPPNSITSKWPATDAADFCGEWTDASITPEQAERRELVRRFALAIASGLKEPKGCYPADIWATARRYAEAENWK